MKRIVMLFMVVSVWVSAAWAQKSNPAPASGQGRTSAASLLRSLPNTNSVPGFMNYAKPQGQNPDPNLNMAAKVKVNCSRGESIQKALNRLNRVSPLSPALVTVHGTCNENVVIQGFNRLTLQAASGATISDASGGTGAVVDIEDSTDVSLEGFTINGGAIGVYCGNFSVCRFNGNTIQGASDADFQAGQAWAYFDENTIQDSCYGLVSLESSYVRSNGGLVVQHNWCAGVYVVTGGAFAAFGTTIRDNDALGVYAGTSASLLLQSTTITGNHWGVYVDAHSTADFDRDNAVTGNIGAGVIVGDLSYAGFPGPNTVTGNPDGDVVCWPQFSATRGALTNIGGGTTNCAEPQP